MCVSEWGWVIGEVSLPKGSLCCHSTLCVCVCACVCVTVIFKIMEICYHLEPWGASVCGRGGELISEGFEADWLLPGKSCYLSGKPLDPPAIRRLGQGGVSVKKLAVLTEAPLWLTCIVSYLAVNVY